MNHTSQIIIGLQEIRTEYARPDITNYKNFAGPNMNFLSQQHTGNNA